MLPHKSISCIFAWSCRTTAALQHFFCNFCMKLSCKSCLTKLFLKLLHGTVMQRLPFKAIPQAFVWRCRAKAAFWNYFFSFCMELSCKSCLVQNIVQYLQAPETCFWVMAKVLGAGWVMLGAIKSDCSWFMILHGTVVHRWLCETIS